MLPMKWTPWKTSDTPIKRQPVEPDSDEEPDELQHPIVSGNKRAYVPRSDVPNQKPCPTPTKKFSGEETQTTTLLGAASAEDRFR